MDLINKSIINIVKNSARIESILKTLRFIESEDLMLTGGYLRNIIWNSLHSYSEDYELEDCDIVFFNKGKLSKKYEKSIRDRLYYLSPDINWSVKNQARMHLRNNHNPYMNIFDALTAFPETCSAIAIDKQWNIVSPYGLNDLYNLQVIPTTFCLVNEIDVYYRRKRIKGWFEKWNLLKSEVQ